MLGVHSTTGDFNVPEQLYASIGGRRRAPVYVGSVGPPHLPRFCAAK